MSYPVIAAWHEILASGDLAALRELLAPEACFHSPVVHRPQPGRGFRYVREIVSGCDAALEFVASVDGIEINGIDLIHWDGYGKIDDFKVMVRPWKGIEKLRGKMAQMLEQMPQATAPAPGS